MTDNPRALTLYLDVNAKSADLVKWDQASNFGFGVAVPAELASLLLRVVTEALEAGRATVVEDRATVSAPKPAKASAAKPARKPAGKRKASKAPKASTEAAA